MSTQPPTTVSLGELITTTFDVAERFATDSQELSHLATSAITNILRRAQPAVVLIDYPRPRLCRADGVPTGLNDRDYA